MVTARPGHSVAELIVAVTFLATALAAVGTSTLLGARWTGDAALRERALEVAATTLDSLSRLPEVSSGVHTRDGLVVEWTAAGAMIHVSVSDPSGGALAALRGRRIPRVPVYPLPEERS